MKPKSIVLLSGGLDSTVNLSIAKKKTKILFAITFDYYQKSVKKEIAQSKKICRFYNVMHKVINLPYFKEFSKTALIKGTAIKSLGLKEKDLYNKALMKGIANAVWVPNRNGFFVNLAGVIAEAIGADIIVMGLNKEEGESFPDNSIGFLKAINKSLSFSTLKKIKLVSYTVNKNKKEIIKLAQKNNAPLNLVWPCYFGKNKPCLKCVSCLRFIRALNSSKL